MSDVVPFGRREPPPKPPTLKDLFGHDSWMLNLCAEWRAARAQQQRNWAEHDIAIGYGYLPDLDSPNIDLSPLDRMQEIEWHFAEHGQPRTILLARELLAVCVKILSHEHEDPESPLAKGPVLEIVRNVIHSLGFLDGRTCIGEGAQRRKDDEKGGTNESAQ